MSQPRRILFVDDERNVLDGLRRMLHPMRGQWKMEFVTRGEDALTAMQAHPYDVIISDLRMPGMDGLQLLEAVREKFPRAIRIMLSGYADQPLRTRASRCVHQFVSKPCNAETLKKMVERALTLYDRLHSTDLSDILSRLTSLPVLPKAYREVLDLLNNPSCSLRRIGQVVAQDIGLSSKILQVVNNAFVTVQGQKIYDPIHAVSFLGFKASEALILTSGVFSELPEPSIRRFCVDQLQEHCMRVGTLARAICGTLQHARGSVGCGLDGRDSARRRKDDPDLQFPRRVLASRSSNPGPGISPATAPNAWPCRPPTPNWADTCSTCGDCPVPS